MQPAVSASGALPRLMSTASLRNQLLRGGTWGLVVRALALLASLLSSVLLARVLGPAQYGVYTFVLASLAIVAMPVQLGLPTLVVRETAQAAAKADWPKVRGIWSWATVTILLGSILAMLVALAFVWAWSDRLDEGRAAAFLAGLPLVMLLALGEARSAALRGLGRTFLGLFPDKVLRPLLVASLVAGAGWGLADGLGAADALALHVMAATVTFGVGAWLLLRSRPEALRRSSRKDARGRTWLRSVLPLSLISGLQLISHNTDLVMLGLLRSDEEVGLYRVALAGSSLVIFGLTAINLVMQPHIAGMYATGDLARLQKLASTTALASLALAAPVAAILFAAGGPIIAAIYGGDYQGAYAPLAILAAGQMVNAFFGVVGSLLIMSGHERENLKGLAASTLLNVVLNALLIPAYGAEGAAIATGLSIVVWNLLFWRSVRRLLGTDSSPLWLLRGSEASRA